MLRQSYLLIAVLCLGIFAGYYLLCIVSSEPGSPHADAPPGTPKFTSGRKDYADDTLTQLQQRLERAEQERVWLAERVAALEEVAGKSEIYPLTGTATPATETNEITESTAPPQTFRTSIEALIETGIPEEQAARIQASLDEYDLKLLYMQDRASRENWLNSARYRKEQRELQNAYQELRPEIGDDAYDRMLYALGRTNRVVVRDIMQNSAAEQYDLRANDRIIEYNGQRVFTSQELNTLVTQGTAGAQVLLRVQRDEQQLELYLPQGPIGIRLATSREQP